MWQDEKIEDTRKALLTHYNSLQTSQVTRLIGFVAGLFTLLQLTQVSKTSTLSTMFTSFPTITVIPPIFWDVLRFITLFGGTFIITFFILRAIFRFCIFGLLSSSILNMVKDEYDEAVKKIGDGEKIAPITVMNVVAVLKVINDKRKAYIIFPAELFLQLEGTLYEDYKTPKYRGIFYVGILSLSFTALIFAILW